MEFVLIPLLAIAAVTLCIYKLSELMFHIHLSCPLLILLVGFAWMISLVLPGFFFHSAGLLGSLGISLVSAVGFAWVATVYDIRTQASRSISPASAVEVVPEADFTWTGSPDASERIIVDSQPETQSFQMDTLNSIPLPAGDSPSELSEASPQTAMDAIVSSPDQTVADEALEKDGLQTAEQPVLDSVQTEPVVQPSLVEATTEEIEEIEEPASDSFEDLLEFAFLQRSRNRSVSALEAFRLIKHLYKGNDAMPMVVAEIVSILQSQGDYAGAAAELTEILHKPEIQRQGNLVEIFEQKLAELLTETVASKE